jgi:hypothetical protein
VNPEAWYQPYEEIAGLTSDASMEQLPYNLPFTEPRARNEWVDARGVEALAQACDAGALVDELMAR